MGHLRRQQRHRRVRRLVLMPVQIVGDGALIDEQDRPRIMSVGRVGMMLELCVENLLHQGHIRVPRVDHICHVTNVQDPPVETGQSESMHENTNTAETDSGSSTDSVGATGAEVVRFDTKVVVVLRDDLLPWQELNVTAFLTSGIATSESGLVGENYRDGDGNDYLPMLRQPVLVMTADGALLAKVREKALGRGIPLAVYTQELFSTGHDAANREAVASVAAEDLNLVGIALRGPKNAVDRVVKGARMHG